MSLEGEIPTATATLAVAIKRVDGKGSRRAFQWATEHLLTKFDRLVLVHVVPSITSIPTPCGDRTPIEDLDTNVVDMYMQDMELKAQEIFIPYKKLCKTKKIETMILESDNPASALLTYIIDTGVRSFVMGSCTTWWFSRKLKASGVPSLVLKHAPEACEVYVVSKYRLITTFIPCYPAWTPTGRLGHWSFTRKGSLCSRVFKPSIRSSSLSDASHLSSATIKQKISSSGPDALQNQNFGNAIIQVSTLNRSPSVTSTQSKQLEVQAEVEKLRIELSNTVALYNQTCDDLVLAQKQVRLVSSECLEETRQLNDALKREEIYQKIAAGEKDKHVEAAKEVDVAKHQLICEAYEKKVAELKAFKESIEKQKIVTELFSSDRRYKRYSRDEIEVATDSFSEDKLIGEGAYGKVYRCSLDNTPVAVKVPRSNAVDKKEFLFLERKKEEFLTEVDVLCQLRHPHIVLLLGACPDIGCLVYEFMEKGSLEDHISHRNNEPSLPWFIRFRIIFEIACGLAFLHNSKPLPIIHRDLKPGNIFIDRNYVSKIGDAGLAKLVSDAVPDNVTEYRDSILAGTLYYMDPEYQRTGTVRPKSDLYAFGIIILQLLTGGHPNGVILKVESALKSGYFSDVLDKSTIDWPLAEAEELAHLSLKCTRLRCRDRPDLDTEVLPVLKKLADTAEASSRIPKNNIDAPSHYFCPILQEVMNDPHIASDGFTYEHRAIKLWLEKHSISPVTKTRLQHKLLIPNNTLCSAIQEWRSRISCSSVSIVQ